MFFKYVASKNQLHDLSVSGTLVENELNRFICQISDKKDKKDKYIKTIAQSLGYPLYLDILKNNFLLK